MATLYYHDGNYDSWRAVRTQMARTLRQYRGFGLVFHTITRGRSWNAGALWLTLQALPGLRGFEVTSSRDCALCGEPLPPQQSCLCFDNHCQ